VVFHPAKGTRLPGSRPLRSAQRTGTRCVYGAGEVKSLGGPPVFCTTCKNDCRVAQFSAYNDLATRPQPVSRVLSRLTCYDLAHGCRGCRTLARSSGAIASKSKSVPAAWVSFTEPTTKSSSVILPSRY